MRKKLLIVDDDPQGSAQLRRLLESEELSVEVVDNGQDALAALASSDYSILITDLRMPGMGGMDLIREIAARRLTVTVIVTTAFGSIDRVVEAMRLGAYDFLTKPIDPTYLRLVMDRALKKRELQDEVLSLRQRLKENFAFHSIISKNKRMHELFELIRHIAGTKSTVLIEGETGTGKELIAKAIHYAGEGRGNLVAVNCAALPETLLESELFGHEKGSFTSADSRRKGRFELADKGTIFLDEIGDISKAMQAKLLRVLQEKNFERVGGHECIEVDLRVVAATNKSLEREVGLSKFREDLFYRLNVIKIELPPLRERTEDIPLLVTHFLQKYARPNEPPKKVSPEAMDRMLNYSWPGNIRQLENAIERAAVTTVGDTINADNLPHQVVGAPVEEKPKFEIDLDHPLPHYLKIATEQIEKEYILKALEKSRGNVGRCAELCGLSRRSISGKISQYTIDKYPFKAS
ncbi:MAG: response regulator with CheY-like receiver, AAA-type ATPase, and DNA-binding domain [Planctomycetota bacterium]|nr:response regulator with CheY-like receiver, AAA-type ATPase, and DNA-binding domain [Planctomycetota bacterium]